MGNVPLGALSSNIEELCYKAETFVKPIKISVEMLPQICYGGSSNKINVNTCQKSQYFAKEYVCWLYILRLNKFL